jgi:ribonuclease R
VSVVSRTSRGLEGRVEAVVGRRNPRVAGTLRRRGKSAWLEPDDTRVRGPIVISGGERIGRDGDAAVVTINQFPELSGENPEGEVVAVLGRPGDPNTEVAKILVREQIEEQHPEGAMREAEALAARVRRVSLEGRTDLRHVPLPTIDPEDARDHDDAIWVEPTGDGYRAYVAIADVSEYVPVGSELDGVAVARGCTIYLPDRAIPMLPAALASDVCSLLPDQDRLCLCVIADLDKEAQLEHFEVVEGVMRSAAMLTYGGVARALGFSELPPRSAQAEALKKGLRHLDELARKLRRRRMRRGALELDLPEPRVQVDPNTGAPVEINRRAQDPGIKRAYAMVEELMLLANEVVAEWLTKQRAPAIYRVHGRPDEDKLERLGGVAVRLGAPFDFEDLLKPDGVGRWLRRIADHPRKPVLELLLLRSLKQAVYDIANIGHFGLASEAYLHFTSPIRRYPDIAAHRAVKALLRGGKPDTSPAALERLRSSATASSTRERAAMDVEREVVDLYRALFMRDRVGERFSGTVTAVVGSGMYVSLDEPFVDVLVRFESMGPDHYEAEQDELGVVGLRSGDRVMIGDRIDVEIEDVGVLRRTVYARRIVEGAAASGARSRDQGTQRGKRGKIEALRAARAGRQERAPTADERRTGSRPSKARVAASEERRSPKGKKQSARKNRKKR